MKKLTFLILLIFLLSVNSCTSKKIRLTCGIGEVAQRGIDHLQPYIDATERYKADYGKYPTVESKDFIPKYIQQIPIFTCVPPSSEMSPVYKVIQDERLCTLTGQHEEDGSTYTIKFYPRDDRLCLLGGTNNICEYKSETKEWKCYMH